MEDLKLRCKDLLQLLKESPMDPINETITERSSENKGNLNESDEDSLEFQFDLGCGVFEEKNLLDEIKSNKDNESIDFITEILLAIKEDTNLIQPVEMLDTADFNSDFKSDVSGE